MTRCLDCELFDHQGTLTPLPSGLAGLVALAKEVGYCDWPTGNDDHLHVAMPHWTYDVLTTANRPELNGDVEHSHPCPAFVPLREEAAQ